MKLTLKLKPRNPGGETKTTVIENVENVVKTIDNLQAPDQYPSLMSESTPSAVSNPASANEMVPSNSIINVHSNFDINKRNFRKLPGKKGRPAAEPKATSFLSAAEMEANQLRESMERIVKRLKKRDSYGFFLTPVTEEQAPGYAFKIKQPMDLGTMERKMMAGAYSTLDSFASDFHLIISNCFEFNSPTTRVYREAIKLNEYGSKVLDSEQKKVAITREKAALIDHQMPPYLQLSTAANDSVQESSRAATVGARWDSRSYAKASEQPSWTAAHAANSSKHIYNSMSSSYLATAGKTRTGRPHKTIERTYKIGMIEHFSEDGARRLKDFRKYAPYNFRPSNPWLKRFRLKNGEKNTSGFFRHLSWHDYLGLSACAPHSPVIHPPFVAGTREGVETGLEIVQAAFGDMLGAVYTQSIEKFARDAGLSVYEPVIRSKLNSATLGGWEVFHGVLVGIRYGLSDVLNDVWTKHNAKPIRQVSDLLALYTGLQPTNASSDLLPRGSSIIELLATVLVYHYQKYNVKLFESMKREYVPVFDLVPLEARMADSAIYLAGGAGDSEIARATRQLRWSSCTEPVADVLSDAADAIEKLYYLSVKAQVFVQTQGSPNALSLLDPSGQREIVNRVCSELDKETMNPISVDVMVTEFQQKLRELREKLFLQVARIPMYPPVASGPLPDIPNTPDELKCTNDVKALQMLMRAVKPGLFASFSGADLLLFSRLILELAATISDDSSDKAKLYLPKDISFSSKASVKDEPIDWDFLHSFAEQVEN